MRRKVTTRLISAAMSAVLAVGLMPLLAFAATAEQGADAPAGATQKPVSLDVQAVPNTYYKGLDGTKTTIYDYAVVGTSISALDEDQYEYYVVDHNVTWKSRLTAKGTVNLILGDGNTLTLEKGIGLESGAKLTIWRQNEGTGALVAKTSSGHKAAIAVNEGSTLTINGGTITAETYTDDAAGIGGDDGKSAGSININAGTVTARSDMNAAAIGGGDGGSGGTITINGGTVTATAHDEDGAGIGGGQDGSGGTITINGGTVTATGADNSAGIGGNDVSGTITINNGTVTATGGTHGAGIGGGNGCEGESITITGGTVTARGGAYAAGIGAGGDSGADTIKITGGTVTAWGGTESAGIGSANKGHVNSIQITGGHVNGVGASKAAGIGGGDGAESNGTYGTITISGEGTYVGAIGGNEAAGLGTGNGAGTNDGTITIKNGAEVYAVGGTYRTLLLDTDGIIKREDTYIHYDQVEHNQAWLDLKNYGAGIGGGDDTPSGTINIENAKVTAYGANGAAGIGSGYEAGSTGSITLTDSDVTAWGGGMNATYDDFNHDKGSGGAGIGGGTKCGGNASGNITISGGTINARAGSYAAGIGGGDEGGFGTIIIKDGADVTTRGGKHGAGIGTGDVSSNGGKDAWKTGSITISGADTKITAFGGDDGGAGIGGGDDGYGCNITIAGVGYKADGTKGQGFVHSEGNMRGAGIGGGPGKAFGSINITGSLVLSFGGYGAGIGGGGGKLMASNPSHVNGGDITITNSQVSAASVLGGAGVGGGIFGRADSITISGGMVDAHGGQMGGPGHLSDAFMANYVCSEYIYRGGLDLANDAFSMSYGSGGMGAGGAIAIISIMGKGVAELVDLLSDTDPEVIYYIGAGIGGGYKEGSGTITIKDDAVITAVSGVLPTSLDSNGNKGHAIGNGKGYTAADPTVTVTGYTPLAIVLTKKVRLDDNFNPELYDDTAPAPYTTPGVADLVTDRQVVAILPMSAVQQNVTVTFDANAADATGEMAAQTIPANTPTALTENAFERAGFQFAGWNTAEDGTGASYDDKQEITATVDLALYAQWVRNPVTITYQLENGTVLREQVVEYGSDVTLDNPEKIGAMSFVGWREPDGETHPGGETINGITEPLTLIARLMNLGDLTEPLQSAIVTYKANDGSGAEEVVYVSAASETDPTNSEFQIAVPSSVFDERPGYTLSQQWLVEGTEGDFMSGGYAPFDGNPVESITLLAQWNPNAYTVKFDGNAEGVQGEMDDQDFTYGERQRLRANALTRTGFEFLYWCTVPDPDNADSFEVYSDRESVKDLATDGETTLYAIWQPLTRYIMVTFDENAPEAREIDQGGSANDHFFQGFRATGSDVESLPLTSLSTIRTKTDGFTFDHYSFAGWNTAADGTGESFGDEASIAPQDDMTLYAQWVADEYTVTFKDEDGTELWSDQVAYGEVPEYGGEVPTKEAATGQYKYRFAGWDPKLAPVTDNVEYTARYTEALQEYTVTFVDEDDTELQSIEVSYGETPEYEGETPTKQATAQLVYEFAGWTPEVAEVTGDAIYKATYTEGAREYTVKFVNEDGTELQGGKLAYGQTPKYEGETPTKKATAQYSYKFAGWTPEIADVEDDATYTATYTKTLREYTVKFVDEDGTELQSGKLAYGQKPEYTGETPTKKATAQYSFKFAGWSPEIADVAGNATYTATYTKEIRKYTVKFVNEDGTELQSGKVAYGQMPKYTGTDPTKASDEKGDYAFAGWTPNIVKVTGDATYTAKFTAAADVVSTFTVTFKANGGAGTMDSLKAEKGAKVALTANAFTRSGYTFKGWNTKGDGTGTAYANKAAVTLAKDITLYAQWAKKETKTEQLEKATKKVTAAKNDNDIKGSTFTALKLLSKKQTKTSVKLSWTKVKGAKSYTVYGNKCGKGNKYKKLATVSASKKSYTVKKIVNAKDKKIKLKTGTMYKFLIIADRGTKPAVTSKTIHVATAGKKSVSNYQKVAVPKKVISKAKKLKKSEKLALKAKLVLKKGTKARNHIKGKLRYQSTDKTVAAVSKKGKVVAKGKGTCYVYAYAQNGIYKKVKVVVK